MPAPTDTGPFVAAVVKRRPMTQPLRPRPPRTRRHRRPSRPQPLRTRRHRRLARPRPPRARRLPRPPQPPRLRRQRRPSVASKARCSWTGTATHKRDPDGPRGAVRGPGTASGPGRGLCEKKSLKAPTNGKGYYEFRDPALAEGDWSLNIEVLPSDKELIAPPTPVPISIDFDSHITMHFVLKQKPAQVVTATYTPTPTRTDAPTYTPTPTMTSTPTTGIVTGKAFEDMDGNGTSGPGEGLAGGTSLS